MLRLTPALTRQWPDDWGVLAELDARHSGAPLVDDPDRVRACLEELADRLQDSESSVDRDTHAMAARWLATEQGLQIAEHPSGGLVLTSSRRMGFVNNTNNTEIALQGAEVTTEDDAASATDACGLDAHQEAVAERVGDYAARLGFDDSLRVCLQTAGRWHDLGKLDPRFQSLLHGGNRWLALAAPEPLAKSSGFPATQRERERVRTLSGYPHGARHELLSVHLLKQAEDILAELGDVDLFLQVVAAHHGHARPWAPPVADDDPTDVVATCGGREWRSTTAHGLERMGAGLSERFWRVIRRYGWWGSAWHEALLRLADQRVSAEEDARKTSSRPARREVSP